ncbi:flagellin [Catenovulum sp. 2E275]|uniref:flagellin n=1 Tax=Catenovulum sp. 2E275 TaxID=2980497 RepID=UPI0021D25869|nr:flagellin [Catenovulum sp. 2E275]MCU4674723.1 flagellin [Catenovulum sp. 2E275]
MNVNGVSSNNASILEQLNKKQDTVFEQLASGKKVNKSADAAAAQQIIDRLTAESNAYQQSSRNAYDGISLSQVADGALQGINEDAQRIRELTLQSGSGILTDADRQAIQSEISGLQQNIQDTINNTEFNGQALFNQDNEFSFQVGSGAGQKTSVNTSDLASQLSGLQNIDVTNGSDLTSSLESLDSALSFIGSERGELGAQQNAFASIINNLSTTNVNVQAAQSRLQDTDYAQAASAQAQNDVLTQSSTAVAAQARQNQQQVLNLLS